MTEDDARKTIIANKSVKKLQREQTIIHNHSWSYLLEIKMARLAGLTKFSYWAKTLEENNLRTALLLLSICRLCLARMMVYSECISFIMVMFLNLT